MPYIAIDPGRDTGFALFDDAGRLLECRLGVPRAIDLPVGVRHVVIELPQVYSSRNSKGNPNDLIKVAVQVGQYTERFGILGRQVHHVLPHTWKGTVPKDIHHARIWAALTEPERTVVDMNCRGVTASKRHNVLDAVALGKWAYSAKLTR